MPGLIGILHNTGCSEAELLSARNSMKYHTWYKDDDIFNDKYILASRTHLEVLGEKHSPLRRGKRYCWIEGEIYNIEDVAHQFELEATTPALLFCQAEEKDILEQVCSTIDGYFTAVIYDSKARLLRLISDRYGLKPLYIWNNGGYFAWASELKAFLSFSCFKPEIRIDALKCFLDLGHMIGNSTWFKHVELMGPSTILNYNIDSGQWDNKYYWTWGKITPRKTGFQEASVTLGDLIWQAVNRRIHPGERLSVTLSGGLDSRAILASIDDTANIVCVTFGKRGCLDEKIARQVTQIKNVNHDIYYLDSPLWLEGKFENVWKSDGMINLFHLYVSHEHNKIKEKTDIDLNGFLGDVLLGGSYLKGKIYNIPINEHIAAGRYNNHHILDDVNNHFYDIRHIEPFLINNRGRRMINAALEEAAKTIEVRRPFLDNKLVEYIFSFPDQYRINSKLYNAALLKRFPQLFLDIPWQSTGRPISIKETIFHKRIEQFRFLLRKLGLFNPKKDNTDYPNMIRQPAPARLFASILNKKKAIYAGYIEENLKEKYLDPHLQEKGDFSEQIGRSVTLEVWLKQVFNKSMRESGENYFESN